MTVMAATPMMAMAGRTMTPVAPLTRAGSVIFALRHHAARLDASINRLCVLSVEADDVLAVAAALGEQLVDRGYVRE